MDIDGRTPYQICLRPGGDILKYGKKESSKSTTSRNSAWVTIEAKDGTLEKNAILYLENKLHMTRADIKKSILQELVRDAKKQGFKPPKEIIHTPMAI